MTDAKTASAPRLMVWVVLVALALRVALAVSVALVTRDAEAFHAPDTVSYLSPAESLWTNGRFAHGARPEMNRTPGYPVLLIPGAALGSVELVTIILQLALSSFSVFLVYVLARQVFERDAVALLAALLYALEPLSIFYTAKLLTETPFTAMLMLSLCFLLQYLKDQSMSYLALSALVLAASAYVRPVSYLLPYVITAFLIARLFFLREKRLRTFLCAALFLAISMGLIGLWKIRNGAVTGYWGFTPIIERNVYFCQAAAILARREGVPLYEMQARMGFGNPEKYLENHPEQRDWPLAERYRYMGREGTRILKSAPLTYANIHAKGIARALLDPGAIEYLRIYNKYPKSGGLLGVAVDKGLIGTITMLMKEKPWVFWSNLLLAAPLGLLYLFAAVGLCSKRLYGGSAPLAVLSVAAFLVAFSGGTNSYSRFRHPIMPIVCLLAAWGLAKAIDWRSHRPHGATARPIPSPDR